MRKDIITEAYEQLLEERRFNESMIYIERLAEAIIGTDDILLDQMIEEHTHPTQETLFYLIEELTDDEKYRADRMKGSGHDFYAQQFIGQHPEAEKAFYGDHRNWNDRRGSVRIPITLNTEGMPPHKGVKEHLSNYGYHVDSDSYKKGLASRTIKVGNPSAGIPITEKTIHKRIGAVLDETNAHPDIKKAYINDPSRSGANTKDFDLVLSHHPHDVYGMSTGRGWVSCSTMRKGCEKFNGQGPAAQAMEHEINNQTHVAYLVPKGGNIDKEAIARLAFKRHTPLNGGKDTLIAENNAFGQSPLDFHKKASEEVGKLFPVDPNKIYRRTSSKVYDDSGRHFTFGKEHDLVRAADLDTAWSTLGKKDDSPKRELYARVDPQQTYKSKTLNSIAKNIKNAHEVAKTGDFMSAHEHLGKIDLPERIDEYAIINRAPGSPVQNHLDEIASSFDHRNSEHVQLVKNLNQRHYGNGNNIQQEVVRRAVRQKYQKPIKTISDAADHISLAQHDPNTRSTGFNLDENHKLGKYPFNKIGHELASRGELNPDTTYRTFFGLKDGLRRGNYYDHLSGLVKDNVPGSDKLIQDVASKMDRSESDKASILYHTKPENRQQWASAMGVDHQELLKKHGPSIRAEQKKWRDAIAAKKKKAGVE